MEPNVPITFAGLKMAGSMLMPDVPIELPALSAGYLYVESKKIWIKVMVAGEQ
jgi:hypothetical protein